MSEAAKNRRQYGDRIGQREIAVIHVARNQLGMEDGAYREMLGSFGVASSKQLTRPQFRELMDCFERAGFVSRPASGGDAPVAGSKSRLLSKVGAMLTDQDLPWRYADAIALRMYGRRFARWCTAQELGSIVAALYNRRLAAEAKLRRAGE